MNALKKHYKFMPVVLALCPSLFWVSSAQASSTFNSNATITYTITSISNLDHPGNLSELAVSGFFEPATPPDYSVILSGDGSISDGNAAVGPISVGSIFSHNFAVSGSANNGTVDSSHLGLFGLSFNNAGSDHYSVGLTLDYQLNAAVAGQFANSFVNLDYYNEAYTFSGTDNLAASVFALANASTTGSTGLFSFNLGPAASEALYADVNITGNLEASPVPLPASFWLLFSGLSAVVSVSKVRRRRIS